MYWWKWVNIVCVVTLILVIGIKLLTDQQVSTPLLVFSSIVILSSISRFIGKKPSYEAN
ncbi:ICEBs1 mobile element: subunit A of the conjugation machinery [Bacillus subtilis]|nr:ICEBs1 mobile element: subunit A of the conjugation machinery [Bacillus subtilis]